MVYNYERVVPLVVTHLSILVGCVVVPVLHPTMVSCDKVVTPKPVAMVVREGSVIHLQRCVCVCVCV